MTDIITLPGLIDVHVHLRDPGQVQKEDFYTGTSAALAGGFTTVLDMPNNTEPIVSMERLDTKIALAGDKAVCDIGFHFGTLGDNLDVFDQAAEKSMGLKIYLNVTTGNFIIDHQKLIDIYRAWPGHKPILLHAEDDVAELVTNTLQQVPKATHICHVSSQAELEFVMRAKDQGLSITCGVTPHHLFLNVDDAASLGPYGMMKPSLKSKADQRFLWEHMDAIDVIESDHAPHTKQEKSDDPPPFGVPGLETTLALLLTAEQQSKLTRQQLLDRLHFNPSRIFNIANDPSTQTDVSMHEYEIKNEELKTKCGWSPFAGRRVMGKVVETRIRGQTVYKDGEVLAKPGIGKVIN